MMRLLVSTGVRNGSLKVIARRQIGVAAVTLQRAQSSNSGTDPIQKLFLDKIREYKTKSKKLGEGKLLDVTPEFEQQMSKEIDALKRRYGSGNMEEFPKFDFHKK